MFYILLGALSYRCLPIGLVKESQILCCMHVLLGRYNTKCIRINIKIFKITALINLLNQLIDNSNTTE
jgi:hypothetical protein